MLNAGKFNILKVMRFILFLIFTLLWGPFSWADSIPPVSLDAKVIQIVLNDEHREGVDWEAIVSDFHNLQLKKEGDAAWFDKKYNLSVGVVSKDDYPVLLDALDTVGHVTPSDFPPIVLNKEEMKTVDISPNPKGLPLIHLDLVWVNSPSGEPKLRVSPSIGVVLKDSVSQDHLKNQTEVDLRDKATIVIGGLMQEDEITKTHKVPVLGNLPLVGLVFRKQGKLMHKTETIIFLTVHMDNSLPVEDNK